jgi:Tol biopolymer transport system component
MNHWSRVVLVILAVAGLLAWGGAAPAAATGKLAFVRGGNIWVANSDGSGAWQLTYSHRDQGPALSPDGKWVAFYSGVGEDTGYGQVFMIPSQGGVVQQFRHPDLQGAEHPAFSPDGGSLVLVGLSHLQVKDQHGAEQAFATMSICIADLKTGELRRIISRANTPLDKGYVYEAPVFAPDGSRIAYQKSGSDVSGGFVVINLKGKPVFRFPKSRRDPTPYWRPQFSRDGGQILCFSPAAAEGEMDLVYLVDLEGGKTTRLTEGSNPCFVERGKAIVFERWPRERWTSPATATPDLWRLELTAGARPRKILADASQPAGQ